MFTSKTLHNRKVSRQIILLLFFLCAFALSVTSARALQTGRQSSQSIQAVNDTPDILVNSGVFSYDIAAAKAFWHTNAVCPPPPPSAAPTDTSDEDDPVLIKRVPVYGGETRTLFEKNDPRPPDECNPYEIRSNVVSDGEYVYFADAAGLQKLSVNANPGDAPTLMTDQIVSTANGNAVELAVGDDAVYALTYDGASSSKVWQVDKETNFYIGVPISGLAHRLSFDGSYIYWLQSEQLKTITIADNNISPITTVASGVTGYYAEGHRVKCGLSICLITHNVYFAQGREVHGWNRYTDDNFGPVYISDAPEADTFVYSMVTDDTNLYLFESRPIYSPPDYFINHKQTLVRATRSTASTDGDSLYENLNLFYINTDHLKLNETRLYWKEANQVKHLPTDAEALSPLNISVAGVHVTQGIQDTSNGVFLVEGRTTYARIMANTDSGVASGVSAVLYRVDPSSNTTIGEPILPVNQNGKYQVITSFSTEVMTEADFIFRLPDAWLDGVPFKLRVEVNPFHYPTETTLADNSLTTKTFDPVPSPRLEIDFYVFSYTKNGQYREPRLIDDVVQTFSWLRRVYPLASTPGNWTDPSPGLRPRRHHVHLDELDELVDRTHPSCQDLQGDEVSKCASIYLNSLLRYWRDLQKTNRIFFGLMAANSPWNRGSGGGGVASGPAGTTCCGSGSWDTDSTFADWYSGHEIGHALGRNHPSKGNWCEHTAKDPNFPYAGSSIGAPYTHYGFDVGDSYFDIPRDLLMAGVWHDLMGYCDYQWISDYTYGGLYTAMMAIDQTKRTATTAVMEPTLSLYGSIMPESGTAVVYIAEYQANGAPQSPAAEADYAVQLLDQNNVVLSQFPFAPSQSGDSQPHALLEFGVSLPHHAGATAYRIVSLPAETILLKKSISSNAPAVGNVQVVNPVEPLQGEITLSWTADDADGDPLTFDVYAGVDGGPFQPMVVGGKEMETAVDTSLIPGGEVVFQVIASDGVLTGSAQSASHTVESKAPEVLILNPGEGDEFQWGQPILFTAEVFDLQDGSLSGNDLKWYANGQLFGSGNMVEVDNLPVGESLIELVGQNSQGLSATHAITITVHDDHSLPGMQLTVTPDALGWNSDENDPSPHSAVLTIYDQGIGVMEWTAGSSASWLSLSKTNGTTDDEITITADVSALNLEPDESVNAAITISSNSAGPTQTVTVPVYVTMGSLRIVETTQDNAVFLPITLR